MESLRGANTEPSMHFRETNTDPSVYFRKANTDPSMHYRKAKTEFLVPELFQALLIFNRPGAAGVVLQTPVEGLLPTWPAPSSLLPSLFPLTMQLNVR